MAVLLYACLFSGNVPDIFKVVAMNDTNLLIWYSHIFIFWPLPRRSHSYIQMAFWTSLVHRTWRLAHSTCLKLTLLCIFCYIPISLWKSSFFTATCKSSFLNSINQILSMLLSQWLLICRQVHPSYHHSSSMNLLLKFPWLDYFSNWQLIHLSPFLILSYLSAICSQNNLSRGAWVA